MKNLLTLGLISLLLAMNLSAASEENPEEVWGGKWDDKWPVFVVVSPGLNPGSYRAKYIWMENTENKEFNRQEMNGKKVDDHYEIGFLIFKLESKTGLLYGAFGNPRMANLVKIDTGVPSVADCDSVLQKNGWKAEAIPAKEALAKITGK